MIQDGVWSYVLVARNSATAQIHMVTCNTAGRYITSRRELEEKGHQADYFPAASLVLVHHHHHHPQFIELYGQKPKKTRELSRIRWVHTSVDLIGSFIDHLSDGGLSALSALHITEEIFERLQFDLDQDENIRVGDHCDLISGTGNGA